MSGEVEFGRCEICKENKPLERAYYHYDIKCECHSPYHFEFVRHCKDCIPKEPLETKIILKTSNLINMNLKFRIDYDDSADNIVFEISQRLGQFGLKIIALDTINDGFNEYEIVKIEA
jgi:hypothetical protein